MRSSFVLASRCRQPELMDQPELDSSLHWGALRGLRRINGLSLTAAALFVPLRSLAREIGPQHVLRVLDVACGGGDVAIELSRRASRAGLAVEVAGCDISPQAIEFARQQSQASSDREVQFFLRDALSEGLPAGYDIIMCSLFLHHLEDASAVQLLREMATAARRMVLVSDLRRTAAGYGLAWLGARLLTRSPVVRVDGPLSVAAAFTMEEASQLADRAGIPDAQITRCWPQRFLLTWRRT